MNATYNAAGQMVGEKWLNASGATVAQYKYVYDGQRSIDITAQKEYTYSYEDGRIMRAVESDVEFDESGLITVRNLKSWSNIANDEKR